MTKIGLQTFTIRRKIQSDHDMKQTFKDLQNEGIKYLELARVQFTVENIYRIKKCLDLYDLQVISTQIKYKTIIKHYDDIIKIHKLLDTKYLAISVIPFRYLYLGKKRLIKFVESMNQLGKKLKDEGINLLFHHHHYEFIHYQKETALNIMMNHMNHQYVNLLMDTYWIRKGGLNVYEFLEKNKHVIKGVHLRGIHHKKDTNLLKSDFEFKDILKFMVGHDIPYGVIEQNTKKPLIEIKISIEYIKSNGLNDCLGG